MTAAAAMAGAGSAAMRLGHTAGQVAAAVEGVIALVEITKEINRRRRERRERRQQFEYRPRPVRGQVQGRGPAADVPLRGADRARLKAKLYDDMNGVCQGARMADGRRLECLNGGVRISPGLFDLDHVHPRSRGGRDTAANLQLCCTECNRRKGSRLSLND